MALATEVPRPVPKTKAKAKAQPRRSATPIEARAWQAPSSTQHAKAAVSTHGELGVCRAVGCVQSGVSNATPAFDPQGAARVRFTSGWGISGDVAWPSSCHWVLFGSCLPSPQLRWREDDAPKFDFGPVIDWEAQLEADSTPEVRRRS